jgi:hypothetical protein
MVVLTQTRSSESIKALLVASDSRFFTVPSKNPRNTYRVLWYSFTSPVSSSSSSYSYRPYVYHIHKCKIDILTPGTLNIPLIPPSHINNISGLPVSPIIPLFFLKLQGWSDHCESTRSDMYMKRATDVEDIKHLGKIMVSGEKGDLKGEMERARGWMPETFVTAGKMRVTRFMTRFALEKDKTWKALYAILVINGRVPQRV